jgi:hypothetical protein
LIVEKRSSHLIEFFTHYDFSLDSPLDVNKHLSHHNKQFIVSNDLLGQDSVHRLSVLSWELFDDEI